MNFDSKKIVKYMKENQKLIVMALIGILLLVFSYTPKSEQKTKEAIDVSEQNQTDYKEETEERIKEMVLGVAGVKSAKVMITYESGSEKVVLRDNPYEISESSEKEGDKERKEKLNKYSENTVIFNNGSDTNPYVIKEIEPKVSGIAIVYEGDNSEITKYNITYMIQALFDIEIHKISVIGC